MILLHQLGVELSQPKTLSTRQVSMHALPQLFAHVPSSTPSESVALQKYSGEVGNNDGIQVGDVGAAEGRADGEVGAADGAPVGSLEGFSD
jgi:hypothetical protein